MATSILSEIWAHRPKDLKDSKLTVFLRLADSATQDTRMTCLSVSRIVQETGVSRSGVFEAIKWLHRKGLLQNVAWSAVPNDHRQYRTVTQRITESERWAAGEPVPEYTKPAPNPTAIINPSPKSGPLPEQGNLQASPRTGPYSKITTKAMTTSYGAAEPLRPETRSFRQRNLGREEDDLDPAKALFPEDHQQPATRSGSREPGPDTGMGLATSFSRELSKTGTWKFPDLANRMALAKTFNGWMKSGITADEIRSMINIYCTRPDFRNPKKLPWVDFLAQRVLLGAEINAEALRDRHRPENFNPEDWTSQRGSGDGSDINNPRDDGTYEFDFEEWKKGK